MDKIRRRQIDEAVQKWRDEKISKGVLNATEVAQTVIQELRSDESAWVDVLEQVIFDVVLHSVHASIRHLTEKNGDDRQMVIEGYKNLPQLIAMGDGNWLDFRNLGLKEYDDAIAALNVRLKSYKYPRRSDAKRKLEEKRLAEMRKLRGEVAKYFANNPQMTMGPALELRAQYLQSPAVARNRSLASKGGKAKNARTKNQ